MVHNGAAGLDQRNDGESDEVERKASVSQRTLCNKAKRSALYKVTCDLRGEAAVVRVDTGLKSSDRGVVKVLVIVVMNCEQSLVGIVAGGCRAAALLGLVLEWVNRLLRCRSI